MGENSLKMADFLVYHYHGKSKFEDRIFKKTGCEKEIVVPFLIVKENPGEDVQFEDAHNAKNPNMVFGLSKMSTKKKQRPISDRLKKS